jgi:hypothetical protein
VMATEAAGKTCSATALWSKAKAGAKTVSCCSQAGIRNGADDPLATRSGKGFAKVFGWSMFGL